MQSAFKMSSVCPRTSKLCLENTIIPSAEAICLCRICSAFTKNKASKAGAPNLTYQMAHSINVTLWVKIYLISTLPVIFICIAGSNQRKAMSIYLVRMSLGYKEVVKASFAGVEEVEGKENKLRHGTCWASQCSWHVSNLCECSSNQAWQGIFCHQAMLSICKLYFWDYTGNRVDFLTVFSFHEMWFCVMYVCCMYVCLFLMYY